MKLPILRPRVATIETRRAGPPKVALQIYRTREWINARALSIASHGYRCAKCGRRDGRLFVDHIKELADGGEPFDQANLEPLCGACHTAKTSAARADRQRKPAR